MLQIALCDDHAEERSEISRLLRDYIAQRPALTARLTVFSSGAELLEHPEGFDVYVLDVVMPELSGIELGMQLRAMGRSGAIIYLSAYRDFAVDSYLVSAFYYLLKPAGAEQLYPVLDRATALMDDRRAAGVLVKTRNGLRLLPLDDVVYTELLGRSARYHLSHGETVDSVTFHGSFRSEMATLLADPRFTLCGSSFAVNLHYVAAVDKRGLTLADGGRVPLSRAHYDRVKTSWANYWMNQEGAPCQS